MGWRVLNVGGNSNNEAECGPWFFYSTVDSAAADVIFGSLLSR